MKKKVIALILIIPLIFLCTIFSVGQVASILADIPVSGIKITTQSDEGFIHLDMAKYNADPDNFIYMQAQVEPANAKNQDYSFEIEPAEEGTEAADISVDKETGLLSLNGTGKAKITAVSSDNAYTDSIIVSVTSTKVVEIVPFLKDQHGTDIPLSIKENGEYEVNLTPGDYQFSRNIYPSNLSDSSVEWSSSNDTVLSVNEVTSKAKARLSGSAVVELNCDNAVVGFEPVKINVNVGYGESETGMTIEGFENNEMMFMTGTNTVSFLLELEEPILGLGESFFLGIDGDLEYLVEAEKFESLDSDGKRYKVTLTLNPERPEEKELKFSFQIGTSKKASSVVLKFGEFDFNVFSERHTGKEDDIYQKKGAVIQYTAIGEPSDDNVIYEWSSLSSDISITEKNGGRGASITSSVPGDYVVTVKAYNKVMVDGVATKGDFINDVEKIFHVIRGVSSIEFVDNSVTYGLDNILTLGDVILDDSGYKYNYRPIMKLKVIYDDGSIEGYSEDNLEFESTDNSIIQPFATNEAFKVAINSDGIATITAKWAEGKYFDQEIKTSIKLRAVKGAVMIGAESDRNTIDVTDYQHLKRATSQGKKIVLMKNVMLGWKNMTEGELKTEASTMLTDYDWSFYANLHKEDPSYHTIERPSVYYLIEFKDDVWGNGFSINADNFTMARDSAGVPKLFKGPLNFVAIETASVKAQDNIVFLVREDGVDINNIELKGCLDSSLTSDEGGLDLTKLNYAGTTLEISSDTTLTNSRVSNGRTTVRIFGGEVINEGTAQATTKVAKPGDIDITEHRIKVQIESSILTHAREFIIKIGSNLSLYSDDDIELINDQFPNFVSQSLKKENGEKYNLYNHSNASDEYFYNNYVIADVTLKNCVLATSGLFTIGMETHFAGNMLGNLTPEWHGCGGTSFASVLNLEGDVKLYDWKQLNKVDSTTLIETTNMANEYLILRIDKMLEKVVDVRNYHDIISKVDGVDYVHGGIAMYGGGKNYSCVVMTKLNSEELKEFMVNISDLAVNEPDGIFKQQGENLPGAAGEEDFAFYMYNSDSQFNLQKQQEDLASGKAYKLPVAPAYGDLIGE